ncbi:uncharacterized protein LOC115955049 [Quercus lobata]|uniref:uncharacterized protein LOC115955049 n=1 Tax=Quercus lobata TaxID=97700 RepID=UPI001246FA67|nr:uncharacterized protein LOC115955049 [Quercus lobata]
MKIFNWVHKRFHHTVLKDGLARNVKTTESTTNNSDKQALLKQVALAEVLDGWRDGILTIGTFGFDPLKPFNQQKEYLVLESEEEDDDIEEAEVGQYSNDEDGDGDDSDENAQHEELNPLMFTTFEHNFEDLESNPDHDINVCKSDVIMTVDGVPLTPPEYDELDNREGEEKKKKGERITLADLFLADADVKEKLDPDHFFPNPGKKTVLRTKNGLSFAKKFIPRVKGVKEDSSPIKNLQRLMRKMLKRKIHPEFEVKIHKSESQTPGETGVITNDEHGVSESVTLLPTQGATV